MKRLNKELRNAKLHERLIDEVFFSSAYWGPILRILFPVSTLCLLAPEARLRAVNSSYPDLRADFAVQLKTSHYDDNCSILLVELSKEPFYDVNSIHKDEEKLACMMACSLMKLLGIFQSRPKAELESLVIYGLLLSAFDFEICTLSPFFEDGESFSFIFTTSREQWRFSILHHSESRAAPAVGNFVCRGPAIQWTTINPSKVTDSSSTSSSEPLEEEKHEVDIDWLDRFNLHSEPPIPFEIAEKLLALHQEGVPDSVALAVLIRLRALVTAEVKKIHGFLESGPFPPCDPSYIYPEFKSHQLRVGRASSLKLTPVLGSAKYTSLKPG